MSNVNFFVYRKADKHSYIHTYIHTYGRTDGQGKNYMTYIHTDRQGKKYTPPIYKFGGIKIANPFVALEVWFRLRIGWIIDRMTACRLTFSTLFHLYRGSQCTYPSIQLPVVPIIIFISHWLLSHITIIETIDSGKRRMNSAAMTIINPWKEYWSSRGSNQRPPVLSSCTWPELHWVGKFCRLKHR